MDSKVIEELFAKQGHVIATLALRISALEKVLLDKNIITKDEIIKETTAVSKDFTEQVQETLRKAVESNKSGN
jgi:hypothetical protein